MSRNVRITLEDLDKADARHLDKALSMRMFPVDLQDFKVSDKTPRRSTVEHSVPLSGTSGARYYQRPFTKPPRYIPLSRRPHRNQQKPLTYEEIMGTVEIAPAPPAPPREAQTERRRREYEERGLDQLAHNEIERIRHATDERRYRQRQAQLEIENAERLAEEAQERRKAARKAQAEAEVEHGLAKASREAAVEMRRSPVARLARARKRGRAVAEMAPDLDLDRIKRGRQCLPSGPPPPLSLGVRALDSVLVRSLKELDRSRGSPSRPAAPAPARAQLQRLREEAVKLGMVSFEIFQEEAPGRWLSDLEKIQVLRRRIDSVRREKQERAAASNRKLRDRMRERAGVMDPEERRRYLENLRRRSLVPSPREVACAARAAKPKQIMRVFKATGPIPNDPTEFNVGQIAQIPYKLREDGTPSRDQPVGAGRIVRIDERSLKRDKKTRQKTWMVKCHYENLNGQFVDADNKVVKATKGKGKSKIPKKSIVRKRKVTTLLQGRIEQKAIAGDLPIGAEVGSPVQSLRERIARLSARQKIAVFKKQLRILREMLLSTPRYDGELDQIEDQIIAAQKTLDEPQLPDSLRFDEHVVSTERGDTTPFRKRRVSPGWAGSKIKSGFTHQLPDAAYMPANLVVVHRPPAIPREEVAQKMLGPIAASLEKLKKKAMEGGK
jgi:hypothetical protein